MSRRIRWTGVIAGSVVALLAGWLTLLAIPAFTTMIAWEEHPGGVGSTTAERQELALAVWIVASAASLCAGYFVGGVVAGGMARASAGLNGALVAVLVPVLGTITLVAMMVPTLLSIGWPFVFEADDLGKLFYGVVVLGVFFPISVVAAYVGGRAGPRLRARASARVDA